MISYDYTFFAERLTPLLAGILFLPKRERRDTAEIFSEKNGWHGRVRAVDISDGV